MKTKLTVTIPSYRQPDLLNSCLLGLQHQTFKDFKIIIIDDNSGVNLSPILQKYSNTLNIEEI